MARANSFTFPLLMDQPIRRRIGKSGPNDAERFAGDKERLSQQPRALRRGQGAGQKRRRDPGAPQDFIRHPISDARESFLHENNSLDRRPPVTIEERIHERSIECAGRNLGASGSPPFRFSLAVMKTHASKKTRVPENKGLPRLSQDEVIMFLRTKSRRLGSQFPGHAEMDPNPIAAGKFEKHSLAARVRAQQPATSQILHDSPRVAPAKYPFPRMQLHRDDALTQAAVPLLAKEFDLGQFGHRAK